MSVAPTGVLPWEWSANPPGPSPYTYDLPASLVVQLYTATATFDGTSAAGQFQPTLSIYSQTGGLLGRVHPAEVMQPGDVSEVTYIPPFGSAASSSGGGGSGIQFDVDNVGDWLEVETTGAIPTGPFTNWGIAFSSPNGMLITASGASPASQVEIDGDDGVTISSGSNNVLLSSPSHDVNIQSAAAFIETTDNIALVAQQNIAVTATTALEISSATMGFFGHAANPQPATPSTLADVIAALQSLGLVA